MTRLLYDKAAKKVRGVAISTATSGEEIEQPADIVVLSAYAFNNVLLMLTPASASLTIRQPEKAWSGRITATRPPRRRRCFVDDEINPFIGTGPTRR